MKQSFFEAVIIVFISFFLSVLVNGFRSDGIRLFSANTATSGDFSKKQGIKEISVEEAIQKFIQGNVIFADARSPEDYKKGHIKGALNLPDHEFDNWINDFFSRTLPETEIIAYCDGVNCDLGRELAEKLYLAGFVNVSYVVNGWSQWVEHSQPVE